MFHFTWLDYLIFCSLLAISLLIGIYFAFRQNKNKDDYILGGKSNILTVAASLIASNVSGITLIGYPSDIYQFGGMFIWCPIACAIAIACTMYITMPVLVNLKNSSIFYYLEVRFNRKVRLIASAFCVVQLLVFSPLTVYVPSIILAQRFSTDLIAVSACLICICYTAIGGFNSVVWTDTLQAIMMYACLVVVTIMGLYTGGGLKVIWEEAVRGERLDVLQFNLDLTTRESISIIAFGYTFILMVAIAVGQPTLQRLKSLQTYEDSKKVLYLLYGGIVTLYMFIVLIGLTIYARYSNCDPFLEKKVQNYDQIVAYFVMDAGGHIYGLPGLFISGVFSAGLSGLSTSLNSLSAIVYSDFLETHISADTNVKYRNSILKLIVFLSGALCVILTYLVQYLGGIVSIVISCMGIFGGPMLALYILGLVFPKSNSMGALVGSAGAAIFLMWLQAGHYYYKQKGMIVDITKPMSTKHCDSLNDTIIKQPFQMSEGRKEVFVLYEVNYWYYTLISFFITISLGYVVSLITRKKTDMVSPELISPPFRFLLPQEKSNQKFQRYSSLQKSSNTVL